MSDGVAQAGGTFFADGVRAVNIGVAGFAEPVRTHGAACLQLDWRPPADGDRALGLLVARLEDDRDDPVGARIAAANAEASSRIVAGRPVLLDVRPAIDVVPGMTPRTLLHSGPPVTWDRMCGPMRGAVIGAILFERWAPTPDAAETLAGSGDIGFA